MENPSLDEIIVLRVKNICCAAYQKKLKKELSKIHGVYSMAINPEKSMVSVRGKVDPNLVLNTITNTGKFAEILHYPKTNNNGDYHGAEESRQHQNSQARQYQTNIDDHHRHEEFRHHQNAQERHGNNHMNCCCQENCSGHKKVKIEEEEEEEEEEEKHKCEEYKPPPNKIDERDFYFYYKNNQNNTGTRRPFFPGNGYFNQPSYPYTFPGGFGRGRPPSAYDYYNHHRPGMFMRGFQDDYSYYGRGSGRGCGMM